MDAPIGVVDRIKRLWEDLKQEKQRHKRTVQSILAQLRDMQKQCPHPEIAVDYGEHDMPTLRICVLCGATLEEGDLRDV